MGSFPFLQEPIDHEDRQLSLPDGLPCVLGCFAGVCAQQPGYVRASKAFPSLSVSVHSGGLKGSISRRQSAGSILRICSSFTNKSGSRFLSGLNFGGFGVQRHSLLKKCGARTAAGPTPSSHSRSMTQLHDCARGSVSRLGLLGDHGGGRRTMCRLSSSFSPEKPASRGDY